MPKKPNPDNPACVKCPHPHMNSAGKVWRCPKCGATEVKNPKKRGGYTHGKKGGTPAAERVRKSRIKLGKSGNEGRKKKLDVTPKKADNQDVKQTSDRDDPNRTE